MRITSQRVRAVLAFLALPGVVAFLLPLLIARAGEGRVHAWALVLLIPGVVLLVWSARDLFVRGRGTLAPWDPPRELVAAGVYARSRNPMYLAVGLILLGWAAAFASAILLLYAVIVIAAFQVRVVRVEEPLLARTYREAWTRYAARVPRWLFRSRRAVAYVCLALLIALPLGGLIYEAYADGIGAQRFAPPGMLVDIGGRRLHLLCIGEGAPTVFFEGSGFGNSASFAAARERIASRTQVCSYDRSGMGWSDPAAGPVSTGDLARDLAVLQDRASLRAPYVIVASSIGGLTAELFARQFPERVAGLVFVDAANSLTLAERQIATRWVKPAACTAGFLAYFGIVRLADPFDLRAETSEQTERSAALTYNSRPWMQLCAMARGLPETLREFEDAPPLRPAIPVTVLTASSSEETVPPFVRRVVDIEPMRALSQATHPRFAKLSARGKWQVVPDSTHLIASSQPDAVVEAVFEMLELVKGERP